MRKIILLLALVLIVGCKSTFEINFDKIEDISQDYDTSFFKEQLNRSEVALSKIQPFINELEELEFKDNASKRFLEVRISMLKSQLYWQLAQDIGLIGRAEDGFSCKEKPHLKKAEDYFNKTYGYGLDAYNGLDLLLTDFPEYKDIIGMGKNKTLFYDSPIFWAKQRVEYNHNLFEEVCNKKINVTELNENTRAAKMNSSNKSL